MPNANRHAKVFIACRSTLHASARKNLTISRRQIGWAIRRALADKIQKACRVVSRGPDFPPKIRLKKSELAEKCAVAAAAIHQPRRHLTPPFGPGLLDHAREPFDPAELRAL